jgi:SAM-dependent methyltransferase
MGQTKFTEQNPMALPKLLSEAYHRRLADCGLPACSSKRRDMYEADSKGAVGGASEADAKRHLATRFATGAARATYLFSDPDNKQARPTAVARSLLTEGSVAVVDLACGAGATSLAILTSLVEERERGDLPRLPLNIRLLYVDFSPFSLDLVEASLSELMPAARQVGVHVNGRREDLDLFDPSKGRPRLSRLVHEEMTNDDAVLIMVGALSGSLRAKEEPLDVFLSPLMQDLREAGRSAAAVWIEPGGENKDARKLIQRLNRRAERTSGIRRTGSADLEAVFHAVDGADPSLFAFQSRILATELCNDRWFQP